MSKKNWIIIGFVLLVIILILPTWVNYQKFMPAKKHIVNDSVLLIYPKMTMIAYSKDSFYAYFTGKCDESCLTQPLSRDDYNRYNMGLNGFDWLAQSYSSITDIELDKNPKILSKYDTVILFHNEYVTQNVFKAITTHPNVIYLYPNSLYGMVSVGSNSISLVQGHGYKNMTNGFGWKDDNTAQEKDCKNGEWHFYNITNGIMLDCYPENIIKTDESLRLYIGQLLNHSNK